MTPTVEGCTWERPIYLTDGDILVMDPQTKRDILTHNEQWERICQPESQQK